MNDHYSGLTEKIAEQCLTSGITLSTAESVTSGYLQFLISQGSYAFAYYQGGITVYNDQQKFRQLGIDPLITSDNYAVNPLVADALATGANGLFDTDIGIGITGFAAADDDMGVDIPYAFLAIALHRQVVLRQKLISGLSSQDSNQKAFAHKSLHYLARTLDMFNKKSL